MHSLTALASVIGSDQVVGAAILVLVGLLGWSGAYKLARPAMAAAALQNFRVVRDVRSSLGRLLGAGELTVALALAVPVTRPAGAVTAAILCLTFTVLIANALRSGLQFRCACLGAGEPIGPASIWRSGLMTLGAVLAAAVPVRHGDAVTWAQAATLAAIIVAAPLLLRTLQTVRRLDQDLQDNLDWEWTLQRANTGSAAGPQRDLVVQGGGQ